MCTDPCCNATSCQLVDGAQCFSGSCCDNCMYRPYGTTCRDSTQECDITEYCSGESSDCPEDFRVQNGQNCNGNTSYCFSGTCLTYDSQCQIYFSKFKGQIRSGSVCKTMIHHNPYSTCLVPLCRYEQRSRWLLC